MAFMTSCTFDSATGIITDEVALAVLYMNARKPFGAVKRAYSYGHLSLVLNLFGYCGRILINFSGDILELLAFIKTGSNDVSFSASSMRLVLFLRFFNIFISFFHKSIKLEHRKPYYHISQTKFRLPIEKRNLL